MVFIIFDCLKRSNHVISLTINSYTECQHQQVFGFAASINKQKLHQKKGIRSLTDSPSIWNILRVEDNLTSTLCFICDTNVLRNMINDFFGLVFLTPCQIFDMSDLG